MSDAAIANVVTGLVTVTVTVIGFLTLWVKLRYGAERADIVEKKIDNNTAITSAGTAAATKSANKAEVTADRARVAAETITEMLNGGFDDRIAKIVRDYTEPLANSFKAHNEQDQRNMETITASIKELADKIRK